MHAAITEKDSLIRTLQEVFQSEGPSRVHSSSTHPFQNDNGNVTRMTRATSSDNILLASPPASPGKRRRVLTDLPPSGGPKGGIFGLRSPPSRVGSLMRAASDDQLADHKPRCIHIKGQNSLTEGRRSATPLMSCSKSNDDYLDDEEAQPAPRRRVKSVDVRHWTGKRLTRVDMMKLTQINRVRSCDSGLEEGGVAHTNSAIVMTGSDGGLVRLLTNEKAKLTNHFLESLAKATSVESISSSSVGSSPSSPMLQVTQQKMVHRFSAYSPTCKQRSRQEAETGLLALGKSRSASCEVLDNVSHHLPVSHNSLSDGELDHPWCGDSGNKVTDGGVDKGDGDKEVTDGGVDKGDGGKEVTDGGVDKGDGGKADSDGDKADSDVFFAATESCYISHDIGRGSPSSTAPARQGVYPVAGPTPVSSLAKVTQKVVVRKRSVGKLPLTAWTTTSPGVWGGVVCGGCCVVCGGWCVGGLCGVCGVLCGVWGAVWCVWGAVWCVWGAVWCVGGCVVCGGAVRCGVLCGVWGGCVVCGGGCVVCGGAVWCVGGLWCVWGAVWCVWGAVWCVWGAVWCVGCCVVWGGLCGVWGCCVVCGGAVWCVGGLWCVWGAVWCVWGAVWCVWGAVWCVGCCVVWGGCVVCVGCCVVCVGCCVVCGVLCGVGGAVWCVGVLCGVWGGCVVCWGVVDVVVCGR